MHIAYCMMHSLGLEIMHYGGDQKGPQNEPRKGLQKIFPQFFPIIVLSTFHFSNRLHHESHLWDSFLYRTPDNTGNGHRRIRTDFGNFLKTVIYKSGQNGVKSVGWIYTWSGHKWKIYFSPNTVSGQNLLGTGKTRHQTYDL